MEAMRNALMTTSVLLLAGCRASIPATETHEIWAGYLWLDDQGRTCLGWATVSGSIHEEPRHVLRDAEALRPLVSGVREQHTYWKDMLSGAAARPDVLVHVRGRVTTRKTGSRGITRLTMLSPKLLRAEFLDANWLRLWAAALKRQAAFGGDAGEAREILGLLERMERIDKASSQRTLVRRIEPHGEVCHCFRLEIEADLLNWLIVQDHEFALNLGELGSPPPSGSDLQEWFAGSSTKASFLARVQRACGARADTLYLPYYRSRHAGLEVVWSRILIADVRKYWATKTYQHYRSLTLQNLTR